MGLGGCLCYPASSCRVEPFPVVIPCGTAGSNGANGNAASSTAATAAAGGPGRTGGVHPTAGCQSAKTGPKSSGDAACPHRGDAAFHVLATGPLPAAAAAAAPLLKSAAAASTEAPGLPARVFRSGPGAALAEHAPGQHRPATGSRPGTAATNATANGGSSGWVHSVGTLSGISAGSKSCFTDGGNLNAFPDIDTDIEYDDEEAYEQMYDSLMPPGVSEAGECCDLTSDGGGCPSDGAATATRGGGGGSGGGGGGPSRSTKSTASNWSVKVMADLQLAPDRYGRVRLPSILMFTHRRPPRDARTEAWWTKIRGVLVDTGRSVTSSLGRRSRRRARTGGTEDGGGYDVGRSSSGGDMGEEAEEEMQGEEEDFGADGGAAHEPLTQSSDERQPPPPLRPASRGGDGGGGCTYGVTNPSCGGGGGSGSGGHDTAADMARSGSSGRVPSKSEASAGATAATAATAVPTAPSPAASTEPADGPGLPGAVLDAAGSASELVRRPCSLAAASASGGGGGGGGDGGGGSGGGGGGASTCHRSSGSGSSSRDSSGRSPRISQAGRSRVVSRSVSRHQTAQGSGAAGGGSGGDGDRGQCSYSLSVHAFPRQLPPLGMAFTAGEGVCEPPPEAPDQMRTLTEEVRCGSVAFFGDALPGELAAAAAATATSAAALLASSVRNVVSCGDCPASVSAAGTSAAAAAAVTAGGSCSSNAARKPGVSSSGVVS